MPSLFLRQIEANRLDEGEETDVPASPPSVRTQLPPARHIPHSGESRCRKEPTPMARFRSPLRDSLPSVDYDGRNPILRQVPVTGNGCFLAGDGSSRPHPRMPLLRGGANPHGARLWTVRGDDVSPYLIPL